MPLTVTTKQELRQAVSAWRAAGETSALVPTMGALHAGHLALVEAARGEAQRVVVSIFVNPTQFGPNEDFSRYPRRLDQDAALLDEASVDLLYAPAVEEMYPNGFATKVSVPAMAAGLCGAFRPGHFDGVATVVTKLLLQAGTDLATFGEKDYQQLRIITRLARDLDMPTRILPVPTVREADGLALSSRNTYLSTAERAIAPQLYRTLQTVAASLASRGEAVAETLEAACAALSAAGFTAIDYVFLVDAETLMPLDALDRPARLMAAAWIGRTRLIDNLALIPAC